MKNLIRILVIGACLASCAFGEEVGSKSKLKVVDRDVSSYVSESPNLAAISDSVEMMAVQSDIYSFNDLDELYRSKVATSGNFELKNLTLFFLFTRFGLSGQEDDAVRRYYLDEISRIEFNTDLKYSVELINSMRGAWTKAQISDFAHNLYDKNTKYYHDNFPGKTLYLERNSGALSDLKEMAQGLYD